MDLIDQKFEKLKDSVYKLGITPHQFRNMVEGQALYEWSPEVALSLSTRFCSWVVAETDAEHNVEETEESKSLLLVGPKRNRLDSVVTSSGNNQQEQQQEASPQYFLQVNNNNGEESGAGATEVTATMHHHHPSND